MIRGDHRWHRLPQLRAPTIRGNIEPVQAVPQTFGHFQVLEQIGTGGLSTVHLADERRRDGTVRRVALKRLLPRAAAVKELRQQFAREAKLLRYLDHPNIAATYSSGNVREVFYIAMEYIPGPTVKQLIQHCAATVGTIPLPITLGIAAEICDALDHAHHRCDEHGRPLGIIHRDVSPQNVIVSDSGVAKLIDFGLARVAKGSADTGEGVIKGKYNYVAPEYLSGRLDPRADLWAVGVVMYEMLTSRRLFDAPDAFETVTRVKKLPIPRPSLANPRVPPELDEIVLTALQRDPRRRYQAAAQMRDALRAVIAQPGQFVDHRHVADWVRWVFTQKPGTEASGVSTLLAMTRPPPGAAPAAVPADESGPRRWLRRILPRGSRR